MTTIKSATKGSVTTITVDGHAGFNPGNDIVCAAASMLTYTLVQNLLDLTGAGLLEWCKTDEKDGSMKIKVKTNKKGEAVAKIAIKTIMTGYELLQNQYPENVKLAG